MFSRSSVLAVLDLHELSLAEAISSIMVKFEKTKMIFCYQNYSDQLWEKNVLVIVNSSKIRELELEKNIGI